MEHSTIPGSVDELRGIAKSQAWERAAWVYAFTSGRYSVDEFAALGIVGLRAVGTVTRYREAWQRAVDSGAARPVAPGDPFEIPAIAWPFAGSSSSDLLRMPSEKREAIELAAADAGTTANQVARVTTSRKAIAAAIIADPETAAAAEKALREKRIQDERRRRELIVDGELSSMAAGGSGHVDTSDVEHGGAFDTGEALAAATRAEAEQRELIHQLQDHAEAYILAARKLHGYGIIGDEYGVGRVKETNRLLIDAVFGVNDLLVENNVIRPTTEGNQK